MIHEKCRNCPRKEKNKRKRGEVRWKEEGFNLNHSILFWMIWMGRADIATMPTPKNFSHSVSHENWGSKNSEGQESITRFWNEANHMFVLDFKICLKTFEYISLSIYLFMINYTRIRRRMNLINKMISLSLINYAGHSLILLLRLSLPFTITSIGLCFGWFDFK